jgi:homoserine dehydrogenase
MAFTLSETAASVTILGASGALGASLVDQLRVTQEQLASNLGVRFNVVQVCALLTFFEMVKGLTSTVYP